MSVCSNLEMICHSERSEESRACALAFALQNNLTPPRRGTVERCVCCAQRKTDIMRALGAKGGPFMNAELIAVGTEILLGDIVNTDAQLISQGPVRARHQRILPDRGRRQPGAPAPRRRDRARPRGHHHHHRRPRPHAGRPDQGDRSRPFFGKKMALHQPLARPHPHLFPRHRPRDDAQQRKAGLGCPRAARCSSTNGGTAPGCAFEAYGKHVLMLPGPPRECNPMWKECAMPYLYKLAGGCIVSRNIRVFGPGREQYGDHPARHDGREQKPPPSPPMPRPRSASRA